MAPTAPTVQHTPTAPNGPIRVRTAQRRALLTSVLLTTVLLLGFCWVAATRVRAAPAISTSLSTSLSSNPPLNATTSTIDYATGYATKPVSSTGTGIFTDSLASIGSTTTHRVVVGDLDFDGDVDAIVVEDSENRVWVSKRNDIMTTSMVFKDSGKSFGGSQSDIALGDLDDDTDLDVFAVRDGANSVWRNDSVYGDITFVDTAQTLGVTRSLCVALGDLDNDLDLDAFVGNDDPNMVYFNDGSGTFTVTDQSLGVSRTVDVALGDLDNDFDLDAVTVNAGDPDLIWLNDGGLFSNPGTPLLNQHSVGVALGDFDGDGHLDAVFANDGAINTIYFNNGAGGLINSTPIGEKTPTKAVATADIDTDGDLDILFANDGQPDEVWLNDGAGTFTSDASYWGYRPGTASSLDLAVGDMDSDGDLDLFTAHGNNEPDAVWLNMNPLTVIATNPPRNDTVVVPLTGTATISATFNYEIEPSSISQKTLTVFGKQSGQYTYTAAVTGNTILLTLPRAFPIGEEVVVSIHDGLEATNTISQGNHVWQFRAAVERGTGFFADSGQELGFLFTVALAVGDLDHDGDSDVFFANYDTGGSPNTIWLNDGQGTYADSGQSLGKDRSTAVALGDFNGDTFLDVFVTNYNEANAVWLNNGDGTFHSPTTYSDTMPSQGVDVGDLDGDGDVDAFIVNSSKQPNVVWLNDGTGIFTDSMQRLGSFGLSGETSLGTALGDLDGDGDLDAFVVNGDSEPNTVWFNDGHGNFTDSWQRLGGETSYYVALGDVDRDGDLDAFVANHEDHPNTVWLNDGDGRFIDSGQTIGAFGTRSVALGDLDHDHDLDAFDANYSSVSQPDTVWINLNDGTGTFDDSGQRLGLLPSHSVGLADADGDGDLDSFVASYAFTETNKLWLNQNPPLAYDDTYRLDEDAETTILPVLLNDVDFDANDDIHIIAVDTTHISGTVTAENSLLNYTPFPQFYGTEIVTYTIEDTFGMTDTAVVTITVEAVNDAPVAIGDSYVITEDTTLNVDAPGLLANDTDTEDSTLTAKLHSEVTTGTLTLHNDGSFAYEPPTHFHGNASFGYMVQDSGGLTATAEVSITVTSLNDAPSTLTLDGNHIAENQPAGTVIGTFATEDADVGDTHTYDLVAGEGDDDNEHFWVVEDRLAAKDIFDYEQQNRYHIRAQVEDQAGGTFEQTFVIHIDDVYEPDPAINIVPQEVTVEEGGATASYAIGMTREPTATITISLTTDSQITTTPQELVFTTETWSFTQTVAVQAVDDDRYEGKHTGHITHTSISDDPRYDEMALAAVRVEIFDNDDPPEPPEPPKLDITLTTTTTTVRQGRNIGVAIEAKNTGNGFASDVFLSTTVPSDTTFVSAQSSAGWQKSGSSSDIFTHTIGTLAPAASTTISLTVAADDEATLGSHSFWAAVEGRGESSEQPHDGLIIYRDEQRLPFEIEEKQAVVKSYETFLPIVQK